MGAEEAGVLKDRARIQLMKCERDWAMAQYYDGKKYYGASVRESEVTLKRESRRSVLLTSAIVTAPSSLNGLGKAA